MNSLVTEDILFIMFVIILEKSNDSQLYVLVRVTPNSMASVRVNLMCNLEYT